MSRVAKIPVTIAKGVEAKLKMVLSPSKAQKVH